MSYATPRGFREALDARIRNVADARDRSGSVLHLRKMVAIDRFLARLLVVAPDHWVVKGGVALSLRRQGRFRMTRDLHLTSRSGLDSAAEDMLAATEHDAEDGFTFVILRADEAIDGDPILRYAVRVELGGRLFEEFTIDLGLGEPFLAEPEFIEGTGLLGFAGFEALDVPALPLPDQVAQKVHAYTGTYGTGQGSTRVKDLVDLVLISEMAAFESTSLRATLMRTFERRGTHPLPIALPLPPASWAVAYRAIATTVDIDPDVMAGHGTAAAFLNPLLVETTLEGSTWDAAGGGWSRPT